jgi:hypothetical protein
MRNTIKAALLLADEDNGLFLVRSYVIYDLDVSAATLTASLVKDIEIDVSKETGVEGQVMVARQQTSREEAKVVENVDACTFLDMMGEYNKVGHLMDIRLTEDYQND